MPWKTMFDVTLDSLPRWLQVALSLVSGLVLCAWAAGLWRSFVRTRGRARRQPTEAQDALTRRSETLRWATELADVGIWFWDLATGTVEWNDHCTTQLALQPGGGASVDHFFSGMHPDDRERVRAAIDHALAERQDYHTAFRVVHPDGTQRWIAAMGRGQYAPDGMPVSMGGATLDVTELRKIEDELRTLQVVAKDQAAELEQARRFQLLAENASDVVMETDGAGVIRWITPAVRQGIGRNPEDLVGERFAELVHPDERDRVKTLEGQVMQGAAAEARLRLRIADDGFRWFSISLRPLFDDRLAVVGRVGGWRDIHREVQAQEVAAAERLRLQATLEGMLEPLAIIEPVRDDAHRVVDFIYIDVNPAACAWLGVERHQLVGGRLRESFPQIESSGLLRKLADLAETGRPVILDDLPFMLRDASVRRLDVRCIRRDEWINLVWRDVTERHDALVKLTASEEEFRLLAENSCDVIVRLDLSDRIQWMSPSITPVLGWTQAEGVGRDGRELFATTEGRKQYERDKARVLVGQATSSRAQIRAAAGDVHWMEVHAFPYRTSEGIVSGLVVSLHVIDAEIRMEQDLERRARIDSQTGLLNRRELLERLDAIVKHRGMTLGLLWCDIDGFKAINDAHGHATGDAVLEALGERIRCLLRSADDIAGRISGDELIVVLRGIAGLDEAATFAEDLRRRVAEPISVGDEVIHVTASIGVTLFRPDEGVDAVLARADDAMYEAKEAGRNRVVAIPPAIAVKDAS